MDSILITANDISLNKIGYRRGTNYELCIRWEYLIPYNRVSTPVFYTPDYHNWGDVISLRSKYFGLKS